MHSISKRQFLRSATAVLSLATFERLFAQVAAIEPAALAEDKDFWESIRKKYSVTTDFIQLENGYYSLAADPVLESYISHLRKVNAASSFYMRTTQADDKLAVRKQLARIAPADLAKSLLDKYRIFTVAIDGVGVRGVRVTPQVFTTREELDALVKALRELAS